MADYVDCVPSKIIRLLLGGVLTTKWLGQTSGQVLVACGTPPKIDCNAGYHLGCRVKKYEGKIYLVLV